jgi:ParB-like chromosome segregation protein Spo0J
LHCPEERAVTTWRSRIVETGTADPKTLVANPKNWRKHPKHQADALSGVLGEIGWLQDVIVNRTTGRLVDGHLRVELAIREKQAEVPVTYVDLTEAEEALALATFDPISAMATADAETLRTLLDDVSTGDTALQQMIADLAEREGLISPDVEFPEYDESVADSVKYCECPECGHRWPQ